MSGFTLCYRKIWEHPIFKGNALRVGVFQWMLHAAAFRPMKYNAGGCIVDLERGQLCASQAQICAETGITRQQLRSLLDALESNQAVTIKSANGATKGKSIITICNYDKYQGDNQDSNQADNQAATKRQPIKETTLNNSNKRDMRAEARDSAVEPEGFADFWEAYPHRGGVKRGRAVAVKKFSAAVKSGVTAERLIAAARRYQFDRQVVSGFAKDASTWLNQRGWEDEIEAVKPQAVSAIPQHGDTKVRPDGKTIRYVDAVTGWIVSHA